MASGRVLEAPADRPAGQRGWRAPVAYVLAVAGLPLLAFSSQADFWGRATYLAAAAALVTAAVFMWISRPTPALMLAAVAVAASAVAVVQIGVPDRHRGQGTSRSAEIEYSYDAGAPPITRARAEAVPEGSTEDEVEELLGSAAGSGTLRRRDGTDSRCLMYPEKAGPESFDPVFAFCFADDRYASLHRW